MIFLERGGGGGGGHRQSDKHWNRFKGNFGGTSERERRRGAHMGFSERINTILN